MDAEEVADLDLALLLDVACESVDFWEDDFPEASLPDGLLSCFGVDGVAGSLAVLLAGLAEDRLGADADACTSL